PKLSLGLTQLVSPTTVANVNYGWTVQLGELGNTWNSVPLVDGDRGPERLPRVRQRHALVGHVAQYLPWDGALHGSYRFYVDDWGVLAHSAEVELHQRLGPGLSLRGTYRYHLQDAVSFFATRSPESALLRTADSDLAPLHSQTIGATAAVELPLGTRARAIHLEAGFEHYFRSDGLTVDSYTFAV